MLKLEEDIRLRTLELSAEALPAFCEDISGMFGVEMETVIQPSCNETVSGLQKRFKKLTAINSVSAEGVLNGTFHVVFDQGGLFTLAGVVVMLPENRIKEVIRQGSKEEAQRMSDAIAELGNMMVGTWDRVFREALRKKHRHFKQTGTFIGKPWDNPESVLGVGAQEEFLFMPATMTVDSYPAFTCGVIFPSSIFETAAENGPQQKQDVAGDEALRADDVVPVPVEGDDELTEPAALEEAAPEPDERAAEPGPEATEDAAIAAAGGEDETMEQESAAADAQEQAADDEAVEENAPAVVAETPAAKPQQPACPRPEPAAAVDAAAQPRFTHPMLTMTAAQIMQKEAAWLTPADTVQDAINKMQQHETGYVMIGDGGVLQGIVSRSDVAGAVSPYLRPVFAKWKRPLDDATLQIKLTWIMTRPVRTITPQTSLDVIVDTMLHFGGRCLPVVDQAGAVQGIVTAFDIFKVLTTSRDVSQTGRMPQTAIPLV
ncbi:MAG: CBS domain-containing protein [Phycisphaerae bacterium]|nr:CBS domain-containing protein [Phycisphaerae bacterium]